MNNNRNSNMYPKLKEKNIQKKLKDKNIAKYYDYWDLKDYVSIIMEFAKFGDLEYFQKSWYKKIFIWDFISLYNKTNIKWAIIYSSI